MQKQLNHLGLQLAIGAGGACVAVFGIGLLRGYPLLRMLTTSVSLAVAAIPEGLPTVEVSPGALTSPTHGDAATTPRSGPVRGRGE